MAFVTEDAVDDFVAIGRLAHVLRAGAYLEPVADPTLDSATGDLHRLGPIYLARRHGQADLLPAIPDGGCGVGSRWLIDPASLCGMDPDARASQAPGWHYGRREVTMPRHGEGSS